MAAPVVHIVPDDSFDDWIVRDDGGRELGHYPTREAAELVAQALARKLEGEIIVHLLMEERAARALQRGELPANNKKPPRDCRGGFANR